MYYVLPEVAERGDLLYKSLGERDNGYCGDTLNSCEQSQELAKKTKCPGVYVGANDKICLVARNAREDDLFFAKQSGRCVTIPLNE